MIQSDICLGVGNKQNVFLLKKKKKSTLKNPPTLKMSTMGDDRLYFKSFILMMVTYILLYIKRFPLDVTQLLSRISWN